MTYFCPGCWREVEPGAEVCPRCAYDLTAYSALPYEEKLILALSHPIRENRVTAIQLLGELRSERALDSFEEILATEGDLFVVWEVVRALSKLDCGRSKTLLSSAAGHPSRLVREFANDLLMGEPKRRR